MTQYETKIYHDLIRSKIGVQKCARIIKLKKKNHIHFKTINYL
jgi:hypothetical protein